MFCRPAHRTADYRLRRKAKQEADKWQREQEFQRMAKTFKEVET
jgi:hypothetical protein